MSSGCLRHEIAPQNLYKANGGNLSILINLIAQWACEPVSQSAYEPVSLPITKRTRSHQSCALFCQQLRWRGTVLAHHSASSEGEAMEQRHYLPFELCVGVMFNRHLRYSN